MPAMDSWWHDLKHGARSLSRTPGFTLVALLTLALGIGANSAIFSLVNAVLLTPLPFHEPSRLVSIYEHRDLGRGEPVTDNSVSAQEYTLWTPQASRILESQTLYLQTQFNITGDADAEVVGALRVTAGFFDVLGVRATVGRTFIAGEDAGTGERIAVLSDRLWRRRFHADSSIVGRSVSLDDLPFRVVGVAPPAGDLDPDLWVPVGLAEEAQKPLQV